ncbi:MAG: diguanylate cyclase domain-containing protein [Candidatus Sumerlaeia bacterium]
MRIMIAEDGKVSRKLLESTLQKWGHQVVTTCDGSEAWQELQKVDCPDLVILDWVMPDVEGPELCRRLREQKRTTYVILLTAKGDKEDIVTGLEAGADDYVSKPFNRLELRARVEVGIRIVNLQKERDEQIRQLEILSKKLEEISLTDQLTGIPNRRRFDDVFDNEWHRAMRKGLPLGAIMMDIDSFKKFNDKYGHPEGDVCLRKVAQAIHDCMQRASDFVARYGGEEFAALIPDATPEGLKNIAESMRAAVYDLGIPHDECRSRQGVVTISLGLALIIPQRDMKPGELVEDADEALYEAKKAGGNQAIMNRSPIE